ncbi:MAG: hypothetical protein HOH74_18750 [Gemmatimonadetes bacterium]|nr:hypothetical protein [Gemmatimonadota bacterium]
MKVGVIGGGSYLWAYGLIRQFVESSHLADAELVLMDINPTALDLVAAAGQATIQASGSPLRLRSTLHMEEALDGADFVVVSISTGGLDAMAHDLAIPEDFGILHTVGDTVGPGGWLRAVRNIPVFHSLAEAMSRLCPQAWMLNVTNPLTVLTRVPHKTFGIRSIGMCPGVEGHARTLAGLAGFDDKSRLDYSVTGIDHGSWFTSLYADGVDVLQRLEEMGYRRSDGLLPGEVDTIDPKAGHASTRAGFAVWREIGYMPSLNDRHIVENWPWFVARDSATDDLPFSLVRTSVEERRQQLAKREGDLQDLVSAEDPQRLASLGHGDDPLVTVMEALSGHGDFLWGSNYRNIGQIPGFPEEAVVETRCQFDAAGVHPLSSPMPGVLQSLVLPHVLRQEAIIDIALEGTFDELVALVMTDPLCCRLRMGETREMVQQMLEATRQWIRNPRLLEF